MSREDELKKALGIKSPEEARRLEDEKAEAAFWRRWKWRFSFGKHKWGFWVLIGAFILFLITQFVIRPLIVGG